ncbi:MAG: amidohydrolase family protein [Bacillota bacterium]
MKVIGISSGTSMVIRAGRVYDGITAIEGKGVDITVAGGLIRDMRPCSGDSPGAAPEIKEFLDLQEYTVMPGMVDCHVHLALDGQDFHNAMALWSQEDLLRKRIRDDLARTLGRGIAAVRDGGDRDWIAIRVRNDAKRELTVPLIRAAGAALRNPVKYGSFLGPGVTGEKIAEAVADITRRGADHIKVLVSGVVSFKEYSRVGEIQFTGGQLRELVSVAHHRGLNVMAHASSDKAVRLAVEAGVDSLEHGYFVRESTLEAMAERGIPWIPTLAPVALQAREPLKDRYSAGELEVITHTYKRQQRMVKVASELGVRLGVGTDAGASGVLHGEGYLEELLLLEEAGLTREQILGAATREGAAILGLEKEMGMVRPGLPPLLIAVRGNPLNDLKALENIELMLMPHRG